MLSLSTETSMAHIQCLKTNLLNVNSKSVLKLDQRALSLQKLGSSRIIEWILPWDVENKISDFEYFSVGSAERSSIKVLFTKGSHVLISNIC